MSEWLEDIFNIDIRRLSDKQYRLELFKRLLPYLIAAYLGNLISFSYRSCKNGGAFEKIMNGIGSLGGLLKDPVPSFHLEDIVIGILFAIALRFAVWVKGMDRKHYRKGEEYGSAIWGKRRDIAPFIDTRDADNNLIFSATEMMSLEGRMKNPLYNRNKNVLVVGGSGSGKTRFYCKPNLMQLNCSYVVTDPKGTILPECGQMFKKNGYKIKVINTIDFSKSMHYNPFAYIKCEADIMKVADALIEGTTIGKQQGEQFWLDAERLLYYALIGYIWKTGIKEEQNFSTMLDMVNAMEIRDDDENFKNAVDYMFEELEEIDAECFAVAQYKKFKQAAGKTAKSIMISVGARLARFDIPAIREMMSYDELELDKLGDEKTVLFIVTSDTTKTFNFIATIMYTQLFNLLCEKADNVYGGRLPIHVHCIMDEFANLGKIPDWETSISTIRSREISASIILQSMAQLRNIYDKAADIISDNCDTFIFLGGKGKDTLKEVSEILGKETIDTNTTSDTRGNSPSFATNYQKIGRELLTPDEVARLDGGKCIVQIRGVNPFFSDKYDITKHKNYKYLSDYNKRNTFDIQKEMGVKAKVRKNDVCELHYISA